MSILRTFSLLLLLSHALPANAATNSSADCFFDWAETAYSQYFAPSHPPSQTLDVYYYRHYSGTNAYLGVSNDTQRAVYVGPVSGNVLFDLGSLATWLGTAGCPATPTVGAKFSIATNMASVNAAFDGTNYLVALESDKQTASVAAQMVSSSGAKIGSAISIGRSGQSCCSNIAFDGTNYLMIWEDSQGVKDSGTSFMIYGQFISTAGVVIGQPFAMTTAGIWQDGVKVLAYGGGKYLLTYSRLIDNANNRYVAGRLISPDGSMGNELHISTGFDDGSSIAFDGSNFFVAWANPQGYEVRGRFVSPSGVLGQELSINAGPSLGGNFVAFDGTNYMVVWIDAVDGYRIHGQRVSPNGALVGGVITIVNETGPQIFSALAFDGANYLVTWIDAKNDTNNNGVCDTGEGTCWDIYGQYVSKDGALVGKKITINTDAENQFGGVVATQNGKSLVIVDSGIVMGNGGPTQAGDSYGVFITP